MREIVAFISEYLGTSRLVPDFETNLCSTLAEVSDTSYQQTPSRQFMPSKLRLTTTPGDAQPALTSGLAREAPPRKKGRTNLDFTAL